MITIHPTVQRSVEPKRAHVMYRIIVFTECLVHCSEVISFALYLAISFVKVSDLLLCIWFVKLGFLWFRSEFGSLSRSISCATCERPSSVRNIYVCWEVSLHSLHSLYGCVRFRKIYIRCHKRLFWAFHPVDWLVLPKETFCF